MAALSDKISWYIDLNASSALRGFKDVADAADRQLGKATKRIGEFEKSTAKTGTGKLDGLAATANGALSKLGVNAELTGAQLSGGLAVGAAAAGTAILAFAASSVKAYEDLAQQVLKVQRVTGATAQDSSRLVQVLDDYQVSGEAAATSFSKLNKALAAGSLSKFGIEAAKNADGTTNFVQSLERVADAYNATRDPATRAALGTAAFGKSYQALIPIIEQGGTKLAEALKGVDGKLILDQGDVVRAEKLRLAMDELGDAILELKLATAEGLIGPLTAAAKAATTLVEILGRAKGAVGFVVDLATFNPGDLLPDVGPIDDIARAVGGVSNPLRALRTGYEYLASDGKKAGEDVSSATDDIAAAAEAASGKVDDLASAFGRLSDLGAAAANAVNESKAATDKVTEAAKNEKAAFETRAAAVDAYVAATEKLNRARADGPGRIEAAERSYANALRASARASDSMAEAQTRLDRARRESSTGLTAAKAELAVIEAQQRLSLAQERASVRRSPLDDQQARVDQLQAQIDLEDALAQQRSLSEGKDPNIIGAQRDVADAASAKAEAEATAADAKRNIAETRAEVDKVISEAQEGVTAAWTALEEAGNAVTSAMAEKAAAIAEANKSTIERFNEELNSIEGPQARALANLQTLKDRGFGDLAVQIASMGPQGFDLLDAMVSESDGVLLGYATRLDGIAANLDRIKALAGDVGVQSILANPNLTATQRKILDDLQNPAPPSSVNIGTASNPNGFVAGDAQAKAWVEAVMAAKAAPITINVSGAKDPALLAQELAYTLATLSGNRGKS